MFSGKQGLDTRPGQDPIVSQRNRVDHPVPKFGIFDGGKAKQLELGYLPWIDQRGGEYFFTPSIKALQSVFVDPVE